MLTCCPSPFEPPTVTVTTTSVSLATKFRIHRSDFLCWPDGCAVKSNLSATDNRGHVVSKQSSNGTTRKGDVGSMMAIIG